ncbi:IQ domain-containing protein IQM6-like isoform X2 [Juglans microcarpa x Juglans regia]|uniref:IQ domain-containing protein IQM6-like isoform X2 n=1 Tax=Juglans microcarpa x Juglans regia TaxID=2249226 RepID=UPI001B7F7378|nr:IQ domain-containing protein IQM6-like isoform X2 [Juglans microcarpa x Juglans regia]
MGISLYSPSSDPDDEDRRFEAFLLSSVGFRDRRTRNPLRSVSYNGRDSASTMKKSSRSRKMVFEASLSFKGRGLETMFSFRTPAAEMENKVFRRCMSSKTNYSTDQLQRSDNLSEEKYQSPLSHRKKLKCQAALKLQKVYRSFRTRRQLADCAVLVEQRWWKLLDFAELRRSSVSFFDIEKPETVSSRWLRARTRAAKVGKGLSKAEKARELALQHWLEAIDPRHRYGHNLQFYYVKWLHCESKQPFFYWLDIGEGKDINLERCPRSKLQRQCIKYLGPAERKAYEVVVQEGKFIYKQSGKLLDTTGGPKDAKWIFVLSTSKILYVGLKNKGTFQHSSFLAGGATLSAGRLVVEYGTLKAVWPHSGHYQPTEENFQELMLFLKEHNVDLTSVKKSPCEEQEEVPTNKTDDFCLQRSLTEANLYQHTEPMSEYFLAQKCVDPRHQPSNVAENPEPFMSRLPRELGSKIVRLEIPNRRDVFDILEKESLQQSCHTHPLEDGYETAKESFLSEEDFMVPKLNLFHGDREEDELPIPKEKIMQRIDSHKGMRSYQLARQLSSRWATGVGPRISCMRDYPSELQFQVLEQANLSPRSGSVNASPRASTHLSPKVLISTSLCRETTADRCSLAP